VPTRVYENPEWQLVWFDYVGSDPALVRPTYPASGLQALPTDIRIDGQAVTRVTGQELWALPGEGWYPAEPSDGRWASTPAMLYVFSPSPSQVRVRLEPMAAKTVPGTRTSTLLVASNGGAARALPMRARHPVRVSLELHSGWNEVAMSLVEGNFRIGDYDPGNTDPRLFSFQLASIDIVTADDRERQRAPRTGGRAEGTSVAGDGR
jgi:hypothetical protein